MLIKYTGKYVNVYFIMKITLTVLKSEIDARSNKFIDNPLVQK